jgi:predicted amidohydrolase YtcJ
VYAGERGDIGAFAILFGEDVSQDVVVPWRRLLDHGVRAVMELDQHGFHPFLAMEVSVTREDIDGKVWGPGQRINRREALYTYTRWSAEYVLKENLVGSIEPGKTADFVVLNKDFLTVPDDEIGQIDPVLTVVGGTIVYTQPEFAASLGLPQTGFRREPTWWWRGVPEDKNRRAGGGGE